MYGKAGFSPSRQHLSDWSSGPKHFTIFSKNCWTVENHLIRETHSSSGQNVLRSADPAGERNKSMSAKISFQQPSLAVNASLQQIKDRSSRTGPQRAASFRSRVLTWRRWSLSFCRGVVLVSSLPRMTGYKAGSSIYTVFLGLGSNKPLIQGGMRPMLV